jgi:hypothetical protein
MNTYEVLVARKVKAMTRQAVMMKAIEGKISWLAAADILGITPRHMRRVRRMVERWGLGVFRVDRRSMPRRKRIPESVIAKVFRLRRREYPNYSVQHFWEKATEKHGLKLSYTWTKHLLQEAGLAEKAPGRGKYRRKRERRPMVGMLVHLDASTHEWIEGLPKWDLVVALDDADGRILFARFVEQEGVASTMEALDHVVSRYGRFCELYTDKGSHFCHVETAGEEPEQSGHVSRALRMLGIRHILANSPQARGRSERAFGTIQGRLPQELASERIGDYSRANRYLEEVFVPDFNRRFTEPAAQHESAFTPVVGVDLRLLFSAQHERIVRNDSTVLFHQVVLQLEPTRWRSHFVRCPVTIHEFSDSTLGVSFQGRLLGAYGRDGQLLQKRSPTLAATQRALRGNENQRTSLTANG